MSVKGVQYVKRLEKRLAQSEQVGVRGWPLFCFSAGHPGAHRCCQDDKFLSEEEVDYCSPSGLPRAFRTGQAPGQPQPGTSPTTSYILPQALEVLPGQMRGPVSTGAGL